jgi:hypothetical protein
MAVSICGFQLPAVAVALIQQAAASMPRVFSNSSEASNKIYLKVLSGGFTRRKISVLVSPPRQPSHYWAIVAKLIITWPFYIKALQTSGKPEERHSFQILEMVQQRRLSL